MYAMNALATKPKPQPFSPVDFRSPDLRAHPGFAKAVPRVCEVNEGEVLFLPSFWWHAVEVMPDADVPRDTPSQGRQQCPLTISLNYFFTPYFRKGTDLRHFMLEPFYSFLRDDGSGEPLDDIRATRHDRWRDHSRNPSVPASPVRTRTTSMRETCSA